MHRNLGTVFIVIAIALTLWVLSGHRIQHPLKVPVVRQVKLCEITTSVSEVAFSCPESVSCVLLLGYSNLASLDSLSGGKIILSNQTGTFELSLDSTNLVTCNWLNAYSLTGTLLRDPRFGKLNWKDTLAGITNNRVIITNVPGGGSLWLSYTRPSGWDMPLTGKRPKQN